MLVDQQYRISKNKTTIYTRLGYKFNIHKTIYHYIFNTTFRIYITTLTSITLIVGSSSLKYIKLTSLKYFIS